MVTLRRRALLLAACAAGCAGERVDGPPGSVDSALLSPWRTLTGGYLGSPVAGSGLPARPTGMYVRWVNTGAIALRGQELLVADAASSRLWRVDAVSNTVSGLAGVPVSPVTALALGPDLSAWVLDPPSGHVLRFDRDGRLLQTFRTGPSLPTPCALALVNGGATLVLADGAGAQWAEQHGRGGPARTLRPRHRDGLAVGSVDGLAPDGEEILVLDRLSAAVHRVRRDGLVVQTLGQGELMQPVMVAADRWHRAFVLDAAEHCVKVFAGDRPTVRLTSQQLGVRRIGALAVDGGLLAVTDQGFGQVVLHRLGQGSGA